MGFLNQHLLSKGQICRSKRGDLRGHKRSSFFSSSKGKHSYIRYLYIMAKSLFLFAIMSAVIAVFAQPGSDSEPKLGNDPKITATLLREIFPGVDVYQPVDCTKQFPSTSPPDADMPTDPLNAQEGWTIAEEYRWYACLSDLQYLRKPCANSEACHNPKLSETLLSCISNKCDFMP